MADQKTNAMRILDKNKIEYIQHEYGHKDNIAVDGKTVAERIGRPEEQVYKTLVTKGFGKQYYVFVIPVADELDMKKAAKTVGEKSVEMIPVKEITTVTGYIRGGCSPIGMKKLYPTVFSEKVDKLDTVIVSAGRIGYQVELKVKELVSAVNGKINDITK